MCENACMQQFPKSQRSVMARRIEEAALSMHGTLNGNESIFGEFRGLQTQQLALVHLSSFVLH